MINIETISKSGQCFRFDSLGYGVYEIIISGKVVQIYAPEGNSFEYILPCPKNINFDFYLGLDKNNDIKNPDPFLAKAIEYSPGLSILRQDPWEVLVSFIISQRKNISSIKNCIRQLCKIYGTHIESYYYAFPTAEQLAFLDRNNCGLGYRKDYIEQLARDVVDKKFSMEKLITADYNTAKEMLLSIKGVGEKIANCVLLYGLGFDNAFPIDVHMKRILNEHYPDGFPYERYDGQLGLVQQYLFEYDRYLSRKG